MVDPLIMDRLTRAHVELMARHLVHEMDVDMMMLEASLEGRLQCNEHNKRYNTTGWLRRHFMKKHG